MRHIIFSLALFFSFATAYAVEFDLSGGGSSSYEEPLKAISSSDNLFGSQSSGGGNVVDTPFGSDGNGSGFSSNGGNGGGSGAFDWLSRQTSSSYSSPLQREIGTGGGIGSLGPGDGGDESSEEEEDMYNDGFDTPVGGGAGILLMFALSYLGLSYKRRQKKA